MSRMRSGLAARLLAAAIVLIVGVGIWVAMTPAAGAIGFAGPYVCTYYNNAKHKTVVGARGVGCCGEPISWGSTSSYVVCQNLYCLDVQCPY